MNYTCFHRKSQRSRWWTLSGRVLRPEVGPSRTRLSYSSRAPQRGEVACTSVRPAPRLWGRQSVPFPSSSEAAGSGPSMAGLIWRGLILTHWVQVPTSTAGQPARRSRLQPSPSRHTSQTWRHPTCVGLGCSLGMSLYDMCFNLQDFWKSSLLHDF
jgi:hypothetical protein